MRHPSLKLITPPATAAYDLTLAKEAMRIDHSADDDMVQVALDTAVQTIEDETGRALITQTWEAYYPCWQYRRFLIPKPKLQSVASVTYRLKSGTVETLDPSLYVVDLESEPGRIVRHPDVSWPTWSLYPVNPITIRFTCGYGALADIPPQVTRAIYWLAQHYYDFRNTVLFGSGTSVKDLPRGVDSLLPKFTVRFADELSDD